ncbi:GL17828 [Drosophila persimilis]|uniref:lysozyme n=1 Tax=Drosophila persimilis TaxID=7234 RepID=B4H299_DROPE|nr:GL17828 [Drosophila persimilis]
MPRQSLLPLLVPFLLLLVVCPLGRVSGKVFDRCELAKLLQHRFGLPSAQVATLVCIAQHSSDLNTAAFGGGTGPGGGSHGIFQISDVYWCSPPGQGAGCGLSCSRLRDDDIADDVLCVRKIYAEHQRISGDGFSAWQAYSAYCRQDVASYVAGCGVGVSGTALSVAASYQHPQQVKVNHYQGQPQVPLAVAPVQRQAKIYNRCELAQELYYQHKLPMPQIPTWVCIAQHESSFNTAAVGRLNADGSADHGLFQISDLFWCTHDQRAGKGCHATCNQFLDTSISDDVQCIRRIHQEHTQISGDGFNAWTVYKRNCLDQHYEQVAACFAKPQVIASHPNAIGGSPIKSKKITPVAPVAPIANQYYKPAPPLLTYQRVGVSYQGNPFLKPPQAAPQRAAQSHPNAIGFCGKVGQSLANPFFSRKQTQHTTQHYQQHYQQAHYQQQYLRSTHSTPVITSTSTSRTGTGTGKVFKRCELAQELYFSHKFPMQDIATWVCIAEHESSLKTAAVGRLNADGSADHGLFQISDLYWCTHGGAENGGKGCHIDCDRLLDSDISDDVQCIRTIHEEHTRISGDGFTAWTVYNGHCRQQTKADIVGCFGGTDLSKEQVPPAKGNEITKKAPPQRAKGKIFKRCELAQELYYKHKLPMKEIPTWVCIAEHESSFNTAAVGRLNADGSADHGLFQISDLYWCTHGEGGGKACHIECDRLLDSDISDDVKCIRTIHEEHTRLSGDGFNAWTVYNGHCRHQSLAMLSDCFDGNEITEAQRPRPSPYAERPQVKPQQVIMDKPQQKIAASHGYANNPFLQNIQAVKNPQVSAQQLALFSNSKEKPSTALVPGSSPSTRPNYDHNPFLKAPGSPRPSATPLKNSVQVKPNDNLSYAQNPFLSLLARPIVPARAPVKPSVATKSPQHVTRPYVSSDSFRNEVIKYTATSSGTTTTTTKHPITSTTTKTTTKSTAKATVRPTSFPSLAAPSRQNQSTTSSPYYAKYQENKVKVAAKTVFSYDFGQNRTTTKRPDNPTTKIASRAPKSAFDVYLNWNKN